MKNTISITHLKRHAAEILADANESTEPIVITQRGRASAVLLSARRYAQIEEDLKRLADLELEHSVEEGLKEKAQGKMISLAEVKQRLAIQDCRPKMPSARDLKRDYE